MSRELTPENFTHTQNEFTHKDLVVRLLMLTFTKAPQ